MFTLPVDIRLRVSYKTAGDNNNNLFNFSSTESVTDTSIDYVWDFA